MSTTSSAPLPTLADTLAALAADEVMPPETWPTLLALDSPAECRKLYRAAYDVKRREVGTTVYFRGIIELSNQCYKDCYYCGIRHSNREIQRYQMDVDTIVETARWAHQNRYGSIVLQSGERQDNAFVSMLESVLYRIREATDGTLGITLSLGEQDESVYRRWFVAGAHRYLLRIETTSPKLYADLHPASHDYDKRRACLDVLRRIGYQVGTGVMIGLPGQTPEHLAQDIAFFNDHDIDMIGMGPYIPHPDTPLAKTAPMLDRERQLTRGLNMVALTRLILRDVNIAATTALQTLHPTGREMGLEAGANIIMPNLTPTHLRAGYQLYEGKPCLNENAATCRDCLQRRITGLGETIGYNAWGDSPHFFKRINTPESVTQRKSQATS